MQTCPVCQEKYDRGRGNGYCQDCHNEYMRNWRPKYSQLTPEQQLRANCRSYANVYKRRGLLQQEACQCCGDPNSEMHHKDYSKPLDVDWLCRQCHLNEHRDMVPRGSLAKKNQPEGWSGGSNSEPNVG